MQSVLEKRLAQRQLDLALAGMSALPPVKAHDSHDLVDVVHHAFDDDWCLRIPRLFEKLSERGLALLLALYGRRCALS
jgi:hypothetical protein